MRKSKAGRKPHDPSPDMRKQVERLASFGTPQEHIAGMLGITEKTLRKHYRSELDHSEAKANALVAQSLFKKATGDGPNAAAAAMFWLKCRAGWAEKKQLELTGKDGAPIEVSEVSAEERRRSMAAKLDRIAAALAASEGEAESDDD